MSTTLHAHTMAHLMEVLGAAIEAIDATPVGTPNRLNLALQSGRLTGMLKILREYRTAGVS